MGMKSVPAPQHEQVQGEVTCARDRNHHEGIKGNATTAKEKQAANAPIKGSVMRGVKISTKR